MNNQKGVFMMKEVTFEGIFAGLQILPSRDETEVKFMERVEQDSFSQVYSLKRLNDFQFLIKEH